MTENSHPRTTRDALIIEAIGDIGELLKGIIEIDSVTKSLIAEMESKLTDAVSVIESHVSNKQSEFQVFTESERMAFEEELRVSVEKAAGHLEKAGKRMANELERPAGLSVWAQISIALAIAITGSVISICGSYWMFAREQDAQAVVGRAVLTVWNELDEKTKARIEQAF
jgi:hypothetical protein